MKNTSYITLIISIFLAACRPAPDVNENPSFKVLFNTESKHNQQGLAYDGENYYVGFDMGKNNGLLIKYNNKGKELKRSSLLEIGHTADISYFNGYLYVANGGGMNPTVIYKVDFENDKVIELIDLKKYGQSALLAINDRGNLIIHTSQDDKSEHHFSFLDNSYEPTLQFSIPNIGIPQGMEFVNNMIYFYTNNLITIISSKGDVLRQIPLKNIEGESQGIAITNGHISIGYNRENRVLINKF